jgi:hypothetical protein
LNLYRYAIVLSELLKVEKRKIWWFRKKTVIELQSGILGIEHYLKFLFKILKLFKIKKKLKFKKSQKSKDLLTRIASGESIWGSCSKKDRLLKNQ